MTTAETKSMLATLLELTPKAFNGGAGFGGNRNKTAKAAEKLKVGHETVELHGVSYSCDSFVEHDALKKGDVVACFYDDTNQGVDFVEILGITVDENELHPEFDSVDDALRAHDCKDLATAEEKDVDLKLVVKNIETGTSGAWYYIYQGVFCRGSGAEILDFFDLVKE